MLNSPRKRWIGGAALAVLAAGVIVFASRSIEPDAIIETPPPAAVAPAEEAAAASNVLSGRAALVAAHDSVAESIAMIMKRRSEGQPVMALSLQAHIALWRQHVGASGVPTEDLTQMLEDIAIIQQRSSMAYPNGALTPYDLSVVYDRLTALERRTKVAIERLDAPQP